MVIFREANNSKSHQKNYSIEKIQNKKIIVKIGTAGIFDSEKQEIKKKTLEVLAKDSLELIKNNNELMIVTSGAVGCGKTLINGNGQIGLKQARASIGQTKLMGEYSNAFKKYNLLVGQFLLNSEDLSKKRSIENIKETYKYLKSGNAIPIVNENDVTSIEELKFGDNDTLALHLTLKMNFDILIILTEIGALIKNKKVLSKSNFYSVKNYDQMNIPSKGFGGLKSKLDCAKKITKSGKKCIIGKAGDSIWNILSKKVNSTEFYL